MSYDDFVASKLKLHTPSGVDVPRDQLHTSLFDHQKDIVRWALLRGRAAIFANTGLGKTAMQLEWARHVFAHTGRSVLVLAPLAVAQQTAAEGARIGIDVTVCREPGDVRHGINVTNYDRLHKFDVSELGGVVLDECFAPDTLVDAIYDGRIERVAIQNIRAGDKIINASGVDVVADVHRREVPYAVRISFAGDTVTLSPNHPLFTQRGWVGAQDLEPGDAILETRAAVRLVQEGVCANVSKKVGSAAAEILRKILLSEMANESPEAQGKGSQRDGLQEARRDTFGEVCLGYISESGKESRTDTQSESSKLAGCQGEDLPPIENDEARTFRAWGQRSWFDRAAADDAGCTWRELGAGVCLVTGPTTSGLSHALQDRLGALRAASCHRSGWAVPRVTEESGQEKGRGASFTRVGSLEILEPGHPDLERIRSTDGKLYFFDLGGTRHPSFSVAGHLVHNSSIIKNEGSKTLAALLEAFRATPFKLACTATPSPNDYTELGTHAEFLGVCSRTEMLAEYFVHDGGSTQDWRLKGHARAVFWRWVSSWGAMLRKPSDLGYENLGYDLPPLGVTQHIIEADHSQAQAAGMLFAEEARDLMDRRNARRASMGERVRMCVDTVASESSERWVVWCELNAEQDALAGAFGDDCVSICGALDADEKIARYERWARGEVRVLVSKVSIFGFGINMQFCARMAFVGVTDSYEKYYQAVRRCWRFGQKRPVDVHVFASELEGAVVRNLERKQRDADAMAEELTAETRDAVMANVRGLTRETNAYEPKAKPLFASWLRSEAS